MINLKFVGIFAAFGFLLSFILGITGDITFGYVILRAVLSTVLSGCTAALVSFVFRKFLSENATVNVNTKSAATTGNVVDIRIDEEPLPDIDNSPDFYVSQSFSSAAGKFPYAGQTVQRQQPEKPAPVGNVTVRTEEKVIEKPDAKVQAFVPKPLVPQKKEAPVVTPAREDTAPRNMNVSENKIDNDQLDSLSELPDIEDMISDSVPSESGVIEDSVFAAEGITSGVSVPDVNPGNDTTVIADAIRTLLKREG